MKIFLYFVIFIVIINQIVTLVPGLVALLTLFKSHKIRCRRLALESERSETGLVRLLVLNSHLIRSPSSDLRPTRPR